MQKIDIKLFIQCSFKKALPNYNRIDVVYCTILYLVYPGEGAPCNTPANELMTITGQRMGISVIERVSA